MTIHTHIPIHVVVSHILPWVYHSLNIDTRRHFGLSPRRLECSIQHEILTKCFQRTRVYDDGLDDYDQVLLVSSNKMIYKTGHVSTLKYDAVQVELELSWTPSTDTVCYSHWKTWFTSTADEVATLEDHFECTGQHIYTEFCIC
jgi:hypothetical protein